MKYVRELIEPLTCFRFVFVDIDLGLEWVALEPPERKKVDVSSEFIEFSSRVRVGIYIYYDKAKPQTPLCYNCYMCPTCRLCMGSIVTRGIK